MVLSQCPHCQTRFNLKDEFSGREARCPNCSLNFVVVSIPESPASSSTKSETPTTSEFSQHVYGIKQKRVALTEKYYVRDKGNADILFAVRDLKFFQALGASLVAALVFFLVIGAFGFAAFSSTRAEEALLDGSSSSGVTTASGEAANPRKNNRKTRAAAVPAPSMLPLMAEADGSVLYVIATPGSEVVTVSYSTGIKIYDLKNFQSRTGNVRLLVTG